jgi:hypothetical protein
LLLPICSGQVGILDATAAVYVAFHNSIPRIDPLFPFKQIGVDRDGSTSNLGGAGFISAAFRNTSAAIQFCDCPRLTMS